MAEPEDEFIKSLAKGLAVIESFGPDHPEMTLTDRRQAQRPQPRFGAAGCF